jgi:signal transduction histidine kinase
VWKGRILRALSSDWLFTGALIAIVLSVASALIFRGSLWVGEEPFTFTYFIFPFLIWMALRFGQRGTTGSMIIVSVIAIGSTIINFASQSGQELNQILFLLQVFLGITAVTFMILAAVVVERERTHQTERLLYEKTKLLSKQRARLIALNQSKDEFIGLASHQLRTPATGVKQYVGMIMDGYVGRLTKDQRIMLQKAYNCNEREIQIINELLAIAEIDAGNVSLHKVRVNVGLLISDVLAVQKTTLDARGQAAKYTPSKRAVMILADESRLRMVLENILDNASKYSPIGEGIEIRTRRNNKFLEISIKDQGIGIAKKDLPKLFKKFSRIDNMLSGEVSGTGLGLYLAKKIMTLHGGLILVNSKINEGSIFTIMLPMAQSKRVRVKSLTLP